MYLNYHKKEMKFCTFIIYGPRQAFKKDEKIVSNACSSHTNLFMHHKHPRKEFQIFYFQSIKYIRSSEIYAVIYFDNDIMYFLIDRK